MSEGQVARVWQTGYTESEAAQAVVNVARDMFTNFHGACTLLDYPAAPPLARSLLTGGPTLPTDTRNGSRG
jgi:hypothetical protein